MGNQMCQVTAPRCADPVFALNSIPLICAHCCTQLTMLMCQSEQGLCRKLYSTQTMLIRQSEYYGLCRMILRTQPSILMLASKLSWQNHACSLSLLTFGLYAAAQVESFCRATQHTIHLLSCDHGMRCSATWLDNASASAQGWSNHPRSPAQNNWLPRHTRHLQLHIVPLTLSHSQ